MRQRSVAELRSAADRVLAGADLEQVYVASAHLQTHKKAADPPFEVETSIEVRGESEPGRVDAMARYVTSALKRTDAGGAEQVWTVEVECVASFAVADGVEQPSASDLEAFAFVMGPPTLHPFAREITQTLSGRTPFPALTLGLLTPVLAFPDDELIPFEEAGAPANADDGEG